MTCRSRQHKEFLSELATGKGRVVVVLQGVSYAEQPAANMCHRHPATSMHLWPNIIGIHNSLASFQISHLYQSHPQREMLHCCIILSAIAANFNLLVAIRSPHKRLSASILGNNFWLEWPTTICRQVHSLLFFLCFFNNVCLFFR